MKRLGIRIRRDHTGRERSPGLDFLQGMVLGATFVAVGCYALWLTHGSYLPMDVLADWRSDALDPGGKVGSALASVFLVLGLWMGLGSLLRFAKRPSTKRGSVRSGEVGGGNPAERPWEVRPDWAAGRAESTGDGRGPVRLHVPIAMNLIAWPAAIWLTLDVLRSGEGIAVLAILWMFPLGMGLSLALALRRMRRRIRFGTSVFELETLPGVPGGHLAGRLRTRIEPGSSPPEGFEVQLICYRRTPYRGAQGSREMRTEILHREEQRVRGVPSPDGRTLDVPVVFSLPSDAISTGRDGATRVDWELEAHAGLPGLDYDTRILVPVFESPDGEEVPGPSQAGEAPAYLDHARYRKTRTPLEPVTAGVRVSLDDSGALRELRIGARTGMGAGLTGIVCGALFLAAVPLAYLAGDEAPMWVIPLCLVSAFVLLVFGARSLTWATWIRARGDGLVLRKGPFGIGPERVFRPGSLEVAEAKGSGEASGLTSHYELLLVPRDGRPIALTRLLRDREEADWLARLLNAHIRPSPDQGAAPTG